MFLMFTVYMCMFVSSSYLIFINVITGSYKDDLICYLFVLQISITHN